MYTCIHILFNLQYEVDTLKITILLYFVLFNVFMYVFSCICKVVQ